MTESIAAPTREVDGDAGDAGGVEGHPERRVDAPEACATAPIEVEIYHGNLAFVQAPVALGHYEQDVIVGSEATLDRLLDGRLSQRWKLGRYPGPVGTVELVLSRATDGLEFGGAIIFGLGKVGSLTPSSLVESFRQAAVDYCIHLVEKDSSRAAEAIEATLAVPLIGSGDQGVSIEESLLALLEATTIANRTLSLEDLGREVRIAKLQFVELFLDRAVEAAQVVVDLSSDATRAHGFEFSGEVGRLAGGLWRVLRAREQSWWRRLQVRTAEDGELQFSDLSSRAGAREHPVATQSRLIQGLKEELLGLGGHAMPAHPREVSLAATLYELLVPNGFKKFGPKRSNLLLLMDEEAACLPWELLRDERPRFSATASEPFASRPECVLDIEALRPVAVRTGLVRQLTGSEIRQNVTSASGNEALVVGDPENGHRPLPAARGEARRVEELLSSKSFKVTCSVGASSTQVMQDLLARPYRVVHLAGHGSLGQSPPDAPADPSNDTDSNSSQPPQRTGMVLGNGSFLTAGELEQMETVPELVFVNCCHLGSMDGGPDSEEAQPSGRLASSFALQLIRIGVRAVIAAAWKVDDEAAKAFATQFYEQMLDGRPFGDAVLRARRMTFEEYPESNTWGAYQAYGDPHFLLRLPRYLGQLPAMPEHFVDKREVIAELNNVVSMAATTSERRIRALLARLKRLRELVHDRWLKLSSVQVAFAEAYRELDRIEEAIECYSTALEIDKSTIQIRSLEQRCGLLASLALRRWRDPLDKSFGAREASAQIEDCMRMVWDLPRTDGRHHEDDRLMTRERLALVASMYKRLALLTNSEQRTERVFQATEFYAKAHHLHQARNRTTALYPYAQYLTCRAVCNLRGDADLEPGFADDIANLRDLLKARRRRDPSFWSLVRQAEVDWLESLGVGSLEEVLERVVRLLTAGWKRAGTLRQARALYEHLCWLETMIEPPARHGHTALNEHRVSTHEALTTLRVEFEKMVGSEVGDTSWNGFSSAGGQNFPRPEDSRLGSATL